MIKNKRADVAITILVIGIIALCALTLLSFSLSMEKHGAKGINSVYALQGIYTLAESDKFLGESEPIEQEFIDDGEILLKVKYVFSP